MMFLSPLRARKYVLVSASIVALALFMCVSVRADTSPVTVNFVDNTNEGTVTFTFTGSPTRSGGSVCGNSIFGIPLDTGVSVTGEGCFTSIVAPTGFSTPTSPNRGAALNLFTVTENGSVSDLLVIAFPGDGTAQLLFVSDASVNGTEVGLNSSPIDLATTCATFGCTPIGETGSIQITWSDGKGGTVTDTISFQSDSEVPEPASLGLLGTGLLAIGVFVKKRLA